MNPRIPAAAAAVCGLCGLAAYAFSERLKIVHYTVKSRNAGGRTRFLHVSDLHGSDFGEELYQRTDELSPDAVMMTGDIADNRIPNEKAFALTEYIGKRFPGVLCLRQPRDIHTRCGRHKKPPEKSGHNGA